MTFQEFTGKNVEEAIRSAMKEFNAELSELDIEILAQGSRGILGVGGEEARILAAPKTAVAAAETLRPTRPARAPRGGRRRSGESEEGQDAAAPAAEPSDAPDAEAGEATPEGTELSADDQVAELARAEHRMSRPRGGRGMGRGRGDRPFRDRAPRGDRPPRAERPDRPAREPAPFVPGKPLDELTHGERTTLEEARTVLVEILRLMEMDASVEIVTGRETARLNITGSDMGLLIGRRGEKLAALQHLVNLIIAKKEISESRIAIDVENYRGRREDQLRDVAERAAKRVIQSGKIIQLEPMPAIERRIVHMALLENPRVRTQSVGVDPNRRIVILPASKVD